MTEQILYWVEPDDRWRSRGYANNIILHIDYDNRTYTIEIAMIYPKGKPNEIKIADKGSIKIYADYLKKQGFIEKL